MTFRALTAMMLGPECAGLGVRGGGDERFTALGSPALCKIHRVNIGTHPEQSPWHPCVPMLTAGREGVPGRD